MHEIVLLQDLAVVMAVAALVTVLFHRLRQPVVLGYILAGLIIGPHTPPLPMITDPQSIQTLSELGVVMLMFSLGLQFSFGRLMNVGPTALIAATLEILLMVWIGYQVGRLFDWPHMDSLFLGAMLLSSSTVIIVKVLSDLGWLRQRFAQFIFGVLVIDDIMAIAAIALLSSIALSGSLSFNEVLVTGARIGVFLAAVLVVGLLLVPVLIGHVARVANDEALLVTVLGLGLGMALVAVKLGFSVALGAFLIGAIIAETVHGPRIGRLIEPIKDMFSAVFFVSVGLLLDPALVVEYWRVVALLCVVLVVGKTFSGALGAFVAGNDPRTSLRVGMGLAQIGEFAFIIAKLGQDLGVTSKYLYPIGVSVSGVTALLSPVLIKNSDSLAAAIERRTPRRLKQYLEFYMRWVGTLASRQRQVGPVRALLRRWSMQMGLNMLLVTAVFAAAAGVMRWAQSHLDSLPPVPGGPNAVVFLSALILAMPLLIATVRKLRATGMLIAEAAITRSRSGEQAAALRRLVANTIVGGGAAAIVLYVLLLSSAILPSWPVLIVLLLVVAGLVGLMWRSFIKVYAKAQISLRETLASQPHDVEPPARPTLPAVLQQAVLESLAIEDTSPVRGRAINELDLRRRCGATIVAIERQGRNLLNPEPDVRLLPGDSVLLLGLEEQVQEARRLLTTPHPDPEPPPADAAP